MSVTPSSRYQQGTVERVKRAKGPDVWIFRWREMQDGVRVQRKRIVGTVEKYKTKSLAQQAVANFRAEINNELNRIGRKNIEQLWGHFQEKELRSPQANRSATTIEVYEHNMQAIIIPHWGEVLIEAVDPVDVEEWLLNLRNKKGDRPYAPATKAKLRNQMSALFRHAIRHKLLVGGNPITTVRQSAKREEIPDILTLKEMQALLLHLPDPLLRAAVLVAASTGLRRSEIRGLKWSDFDFEKLWLNLKRGYVGKHVTNLKTEASRKGIPITNDLAEALTIWRCLSPYQADEDWVFASAAKGGKVPVWFDIIVPRHLHRAAKAAGIHKAVGWHTFRHSLASLLAEKGEGIKVVQELLRHAKSSTTQDLYQQADSDSKRNAQGHVKSLFVVARAS
jgi:integrase